MAIQSIGRLVAAAILLSAFLSIGPAEARTIRIVALGDSLVAGLGLAQTDSFAAKLQEALAKRGHDVAVINAGVSGDTAGDGLARLDWSVPPDADAVIVELGANDALRGLDPRLTREMLDKVLAELKRRGLPVLLAGMQAPRNLGPDYAANFDPIYPELAKKYGTVFYPFFLEGVATLRDLNQRDGIHPNGAGVTIIVEGILPAVETLIARAKP